MPGRADQKEVEETHRRNRRAGIMLGFTDYNSNVYFSKKIRKTLKDLKQNSDILRYALLKYYLEWDLSGIILQFFVGI